MVHAVRMARRVVRDRGAVLKLFDELAPRFFGRPGGYTRIVKLPQRPGDAAPMSMLELMPDEARRVGQDRGDKGDKPGQGREGREGRQGRQGRRRRAATSPAKSSGGKAAGRAEGAKKPKRLPRSSPFVRRYSFVPVLSNVWVARRWSTL